MKATEITKELGRQWKELSQEEKDEYNQRSKEMNAELKSQSENEEEKPKIHIDVFCGLCGSIATKCGCDYLGPNPYKI